MLAARCGAASRSSCRGAIRATPGPSASAFAASAPRCTRWPACARWKTRWASRFRPTPTIIRNIMFLTQYGAGPRDPLLPPARARLGGRGFGAQGRSRRHRRPGAEGFARTGRLPAPDTSRDIAGTVKKFVDSGQLGIFQNAYWGHPAYKLPPEANLMAVAHYLEALKWQKEIIKIHTIFGGKNPHPQLPGGRRSSRHRAAKRQRHQHGAAQHGARSHPAGHQHRGGPLHSRPAGGGVVLSRVDQDRRRPGQLHGLRRPAAKRHRRCLQVPLPARRHPQQESRGSSSASILPIPTQIQEEIAHSWYKYPGGRDLAASLRWRHRAQLHRPPSRPISNWTKPRPTPG